MLVPDQKLFQQEMRFRLAPTNSQEFNVFRSTPFIEAPSYYLTAHFTGRANELVKVEELLGFSFGDSPTRCVIHGMPGLGKAQLGPQFAKWTYGKNLIPSSFNHWNHVTQQQLLMERITLRPTLLRLESWSEESGVCL
jgi:hypothetical protein